MARNERNDVDYFPHPVAHGKKMFYLRSIYGNDGYSVWFMLLENIGKASYHYLDLSDEVELMYLSSELKVTDIVLKEIINCLVKFGEFDEELWNENYILFNEKFIDNISDAYKKRNNDCINKESLLILLEAKGIRKPSKGNPNEGKSTLKGGGSTQRIVKDSKLKKTKEEEMIARANSFGLTLNDFTNNDNREEIIKFWNYWTEPNKSKSKLRFEMERTWDTQKRITTWLSNSEKFKK